MSKTNNLGIEGSVASQCPVDRAIDALFLNYRAVQPLDSLAATASGSNAFAEGSHAFFNLPLVQCAGTVDLGSGDTGILNYAFTLEQLEAAFYTQVIQNPIIRPFIRG